MRRGAVADVVATMRESAGSHRPALHIVDISRGLPGAFAALALVSKSQESQSHKPRLTERQPSTAVGCPG